mmetsp:Transcript_42771/g.119026  ORF Transcript_42771/g.119026 Transcript_42771/m.119026 type:complete len:82 (-) Transcript_42771:161-406(-)
MLAAITKRPSKTETRMKQTIISSLAQFADGLHLEIEIKMPSLELCATFSISLEAFSFRSSQCGNQLGHHQKLNHNINHTSK